MHNYTGYTRLALENKNTDSLMNIASYHKTNINIYNSAWIWNINLTFCM